MQQSLLSMAARDQKMDQSLDAIIQGLGRLKGIAIDMHEEVRLQSVMIDEITAKVFSFLISCMHKCPPDVSAGRECQQRASQHQQAYGPSSSTGGR
mmetsp:Transcript_9429/g.27064  ORF Transcript_9429/g.27064 Transcript_9429/m.27064 type:complete len:96 (-) Transcript_9429:487-774(-)